MKSTRLVDFLEPPKNKIFRIVGYENGYFFDREFGFNNPFEEERKDGNTTEVFNSLCEIVNKLNCMEVGETIFHNCIRDDQKFSKCVIYRRV